MNQLSRRRVLQGIAGTAITTALAGCGGDQQGAGGSGESADTDVLNVTSTPDSAIPSTAEGGVTVAAQEQVDRVRFAWWGDMGNLTPFQVSTTGPAGAVLLTLTYDTLTWKDETGIIPWLALEWDSARDGMSYTFRLVDNATWHDGEPLTADDVAFSFSYYAGHPYRWMATDMVESSAVIGPSEVRITLKHPHAAFLEDVAGVVPIIPKHIWEAVDDPIKYSGKGGAIGSGPFKLAEHNAGEGAYRLEANEGYWRGQPAMSEWWQVTVPSETRIQVAQQGDVDVTLSADASVREVLEGSERLEVFETAPLSLVRLVINTEVPPLDQREVRQAIAYALDRARIAETITNGPPIVGSAGVVPPETPWYNPDLTQYDFDPERARELLGGHEYAITLLADNDDREPELIQPMLEAVGITLEVQRVDSTTKVDLMGEGSFQMALTAHIGVGGDPDYLRRWYAGEETNAFARGSIFYHEEYRSLGEQQAETLDSEQRRETVFRMQEILAEELPTIVLYHRRFYWVYDASVFTPMQTWGGLMNGIPFPNNKLILIES